MWRYLSHVIASVGMREWRESGVEVACAVSRFSLCAWPQQFAGAFDVRKVFYKTLRRRDSGDIARVGGQQWQDGEV